MKTRNDLSRRERRAVAACQYVKAAWYQALRDKRHSAKVIAELSAHRGFDFSRDWRS